MTILYKLYLYAWYWYILLTHSSIQLLSLSQNVDIRRKLRSHYVALCRRWGSPTEPEDVEIYSASHEEVVAEAGRIKEGKERKNKMFMMTRVSTNEIYPSLDTQTTDMCAEISDIPQRESLTDVEEKGESTRRRTLSSRSLGDQLGLPKITASSPGHTNKGYENYCSWVIPENENWRKISNWEAANHVKYIWCGSQIFIDEVTSERARYLNQNTYQKLFC